MKKTMFLFFLMGFVFMLAACSSSSYSSNSSSAGQNQSHASKANHAVGKSTASYQPSQQPSTPQKYGPEQAGTGLAVIPKSNRMVIYTANMAVTVRHFQKSRNQIQSLIAKDGGYIVNSTFSQSNNANPTGSLTARIPQNRFHSFMEQVGKIAESVTNSQIQGKDVTKQYVDLNSRLRAQMEVKARLNSFLKKATDSSDLLKISNQLANVQEQIEQIKGQIHYLQNHSALATVTITMTETGAGLTNQKDLNTSGKIQQAFTGSLNFILNMGSALAVFFIGYSPILFIIFIIVFAAYFLYRRRKRMKNEP